MKGITRYALPKGTEIKNKMAVTIPLTVMALPDSTDGIPLKKNEKKTF